MMDFCLGEWYVQILHLPIQCKLCTLLFVSKRIFANFAITTIMQILHITFAKLKHRTYFTR